MCDSEPRHWFVGLDEIKAIILLKVMRVNDLY
jgi:hypothetical protein